MIEGVVVVSVQSSAPGPADPPIAATGSSDPDLELARAAAAGDRDAWDALVDRHVATLWTVAARHGLADPDAADVVQVAWLRLLEHVAELRPPARLGPWLVTTAQREAVRRIAHGRCLPGPGIPGRKEQFGPASGAVPSAGPSGCGGIASPIA
jgi:hypothetical protein